MQRKIRGKKHIIDINCFNPRSTCVCQEARAIIIETVQSVVDWLAQNAFLPYSMQKLESQNQSPSIACCFGSDLGSAKRMHSSRLDLELSHPGEWEAVARPICWC